MDILYVVQPSGNFLTNETIWSLHNNFKQQPETFFEMKSERTFELLDKISRPYNFRFFNGCLPQFSFGPFLNSLTQLSDIGQYKVFSDEFYISISAGFFWWKGSQISAVNIINILDCQRNFLSYVVLRWTWNEIDNCEGRTFPDLDLCKKITALLNAYVTWSRIKNNRIKKIFLRLKQRVWVRDIAK